MHLTVMVWCVMSITKRVVSISSPAGGLPLPAALPATSTACASSGPLANYTRNLEQVADITILLANMQTANMAVDIHTSPPKPNHTQ
jgi:hypothetical protein